MWHSENKELHQDKSHESRWRNSEELGNQDIVCERGQANLDGGDGRQPSGEDHLKILRNLPEVIVPPASKYPELV
jgi:hypothetical protein